MPPTIVGLLLLTVRLSQDSFRKSGTDDELTITEIVYQSPEHEKDSENNTLAGD